MAQLARLGGARESFVCLWLQPNHREEKLMIAIPVVHTIPACVKVAAAEQREWGGPGMRVVVSSCQITGGYVDATVYLHSTDVFTTGPAVWAHWRVRMVIVDGTVVIPNKAINVVADNSPPPRRLV